MKKILVAVVLLFVAAVIISPKIVGSQFSNGIQTTVDNINKNPAYTAKVTSIESSWFNTIATVIFKLNMADMSDTTGQPPADLSINVEVSASHGPLIFNDGLAIAWLRTTIQTQNTQFPEGLSVVNNDPIYQFTGLTSLLGTTTYNDSIAAVDYIDPATQGHISFSGLKGSGELSGDGIEYNAQSDGLTMAVENAIQFDMKNISFALLSSESISGMMTQGLYDSKGEFASELITFNDLAKNTELRIVDIKLNAETQYDEATDLGNIMVNTTVASADAPNMNLTDLNSDIEFKNLLATFVRAYQSFTNKMIDNADNPQQMQSDLETFMNTHLLAQLQAKPEYNFNDFSGKINGSKFSAKIMTSLGEITSLPDSLEDTDFWKQHIIVESEMMMEEAAAQFIASKIVASQLAANPNFIALSAQQQAEILAQQVQGTIQGLIQQGLVVVEDEKYRLTFTFQDGIALLNSNQIPL